MSRKLLRLAALAAVLGSALADTTYSIETTWNGEAIDHDPATVTLSTNQEGELVVEASAPFFNSPLLPNNLVVEGEGQCPQRPHGTLYNYEVVEAFFLNDDDQYLEVELSPQGLYLFLLLDGYRQDVLSLLPLSPKGTNYTEPCQTEGCNDRWVTSAVIPREYLPAKVTKFNAYAIHSQPWGGNNPDNIVYQSLYPADPSVVSNPDFHYLDGFKPIDLEEAAGYQQSPEASDIWAQSKAEKAYTFNYNLDTQNTCLPTPAGYSASLSTFKSVSTRCLIVDFEIRGGPNYSPYIPGCLQKGGTNSDLTLDTESFWLSLTGADKSQVRYGVNPYNASRAVAVSPAGQESGAMSAKSECNFDLVGGGRLSRWSCSLSIPMDSLPEGGPVAMQALLSHSSGVAAGAADGPFVAALCPGVPVGSGEEALDWVGCQVDPRTLYVEAPESA